MTLELETLSDPTIRRVLQLLVAAGKIGVDDLDCALGAIDSASGDPHGFDLDAAIRTFQLRSGLVPLFVVVDDYAPHQRAFFATTEDASEYLARCAPAWNARVAGLAWAQPDRLHAYLLPASQPWRPCTEQGVSGELCSGRLGHQEDHCWLPCQ